MPISLDNLPQLIRDHEQICREEAELAGRRKEALKRLKSDFNAGSIEEVEKVIDRLADRRERIGAKYLREYNKVKDAVQEYRKRRDTVR